MGGKGHAGGCCDDRGGDQDPPPVGQAGTAKLDADGDHARAGDGPDAERDRDRDQGVAPGDECGQDRGDCGGRDRCRQAHSVPGWEPDRGRSAVQAGRERIAADGLPIGIQIVGPNLRDRTVTAFAQTLASLIGGFAPPPAYAAATT